MNNKKYYDYSQIHGFCETLATRLKGTKFDSVVGVSRGGLIPATIIAEHMNVDRTAQVIAVVVGRSGLAIGGIRGWRVRTIAHVFRVVVEFCVARTFRPAITALEIRAC